MNRIYFLIFLFSFHSAHCAVHLSETGTGQAVIVPMYSVSNSLNTLLSLNNTQDQPKAIKVHIRESRDGKAIYSFNVYLRANDIWVMALAKANDSILLLAPDDSCVHNVGEPELIEDMVWNTGYIEVIEMGVLSDDTGIFIGENSQSESCDLIEEAWDNQNPEAMWVNDPGFGMLPSTGGLSVTSTIIDVSSGFAFDLNSIHIEQFHQSDTVFHTDTASQLPDLSSADPISLVYYQGEAVKTLWPTGYEAISALFMKNSLENEFSYEASVGAITEWVISFPTFRYHLENEESSKPFLISRFPDSDLYGFNFPYIGAGRGYVIYDRNSEAFTMNNCGGIICPPMGALSLHHLVNIYLIQDTGNLQHSILADEDDPNRYNASLITSTLTATGKVNLDLSDQWMHSTGNDRGQDPNTEEVHVYHGLPAIGFSFISYRNANAQPGLLATYASARPHYGERTIEVLTAVSN